MTESTPHQRLISLRTEGLTWREMDDGIVVLDLEENVYLSINGTGADIWPQLVTGATVEALVTTLLDVYDVTTEQATADVEHFLRSLRQQKLLA